MCSLALVCTLLVACSSSWRAPVESRGSRAANPPRPVIRGDRYRVQSGDTLYGIAWQAKVDYRSVAAWNGIRPPYRIYPGQTLRLRPPPARRVPPRAPAPTAQRKPSTQQQAKPKAAPAPRPKAAKPAPAPSEPSRRSLGWRWPVQGKVVSRFKAGDPLRNGIKIAGRSGDTIRAAEGGKVVYGGSGLIGYGRLIIVKHNDKYLSAYGHNRSILVKEGDRVTKGQKIAEMGVANNGDAQLHFEIRRDGKPVDPLRLLPRP